MPAEPPFSQSGCREPGDPGADAELSHLLQESTGRHQQRQRVQAMNWISRDLLHYHRNDTRH
jgi:hypothetical protein